MFSAWSYLERVVSADKGSGTLKDVVNEALRYCREWNTHTY